MGTARHPAGILVTALVTALVATLVGCGTAGDDPQAGPGPDPGVPGGSYSLAAWSVDGQTVPVVGPVRLVLDPTFGSAVLETGCGVQFGAYTLLADGRAGVTLAGGRPSPCNDATAEQEELLVTTLGSVDSWEVDGGVLTLAGQDANLSLARP